MLRLRIFLVCFFIGVASLSAQVGNTNNVDVTSVNVDNLTDTQLQTAWARAQAQGYTIDQFVAMARARGMQEAQAMMLPKALLKLLLKPTSCANLLTKEIPSVTAVTNLKRTHLHRKTTRYSGWISSKIRRFHLLLT